MANNKFTSFDSFLDDIAFDLWTKVRSGRLSLSSNKYPSPAGTDYTFKWVYTGAVPKRYEDGFFCSHDDAKEIGSEIRNATSELKHAEDKLIKKGVVSINRGNFLDLRVADGFPSGLAADLLHVAQAELVHLGECMSAIMLFELGKRYNRSERELYEKICEYFSKPSDSKGL